MTEILYRDDIEPESFIPALVASIISYAIFAGFENFRPTVPRQSTFIA